MTIVKSKAKDWREVLSGHLAAIEQELAALDTFLLQTAPKARKPKGKKRRA